MNSRPAANLSGQARRLGFGLSTLLGLRRLGFFIPYRYAGAMEVTGYPALDPYFLAAEPAFLARLETLDAYSGDLLRILEGGGPARFDQDWFPRLDAAIAYALVRREQPRRIVEIGSGHSTRFLARAVQDGQLDTAVTAIDPSPRARLDGLGVTHVQALLADADPAVFDTLGPGDMLFVDSSHVAMPGTDVDRLVGHILPRQPAGVLVHVHDILLPDAYPEAWTWRGYNEATVVAALLCGGGHDLVWSSHWIASRHPDRLQTGIVARLPLVAGARDTSLWFRTGRPGPARA